MKKVKKFVSLIVAVVMAMAMAVTAFADDTTGTTGTITVENPIEGQTYTAYKIFDVVYNAGKDAYSYTITNKTGSWYEDIKNYSGLTFTQINDTDTYVVTKNNNFSAADFSKTLKGKINGKTGIPLKKDGNVVKAEKLDLGYYFVASESGALCNLTTTDPDATIHDKNDRPFSKKSDKTSVEVGEKITYTVTGKVPNTTGFTAFTYEITDTMSEGLTFNLANAEFTVKVNGSTLIDNYTVTENGNGFILKIDVMKLQTYVGKTIEVTYKAIVNEKAVAEISNNSALLRYSNDPTTDSTTTSGPVEVPAYSAKIVIDKYETGDQDKKLAGAKFVLKNTVGKFYKYDATAKEVSWVDSETEATEVTTDNKGAAEFIGLADGTYYLHETEAPKGYNKLTSDKEIIINGSQATTSNKTSLVHTEGVANNTGSMLPSTGGIGTTIFYVLGGILVLGAAVVLVVRRRTEK